MIRVRVRCGPGGAELTAQGQIVAVEPLLAPAGQDIVCAAVSSVLYTLAGLLDANGELEAFAQGEGSTRIAARGERGTKSVARAAEILRGLAEQWPECLRVEETAFE